MYNRQPGTWSTGQKQRAAWNKATTRNGKGIMANSNSISSSRLAKLRSSAACYGHLEAARLLSGESAETVADVLASLVPALAVATLWEFPDEQRDAVLACAPKTVAVQWARNHSFHSGSVGRLMESTRAIFNPDALVSETIARLSELVQKQLISYGYVADTDGRLIGLLIFRDLLFARGDQPLSEVMLSDPYCLTADTGVEDAMRGTVIRHYPEYPVVDDDGRLIGIVRGQSLFEQHAFELSSQAGRMVGVEADERLTTNWRRSLRFRQPWLQLNLVTAFAAAAVVGYYQETVDQIVLLAAFLPVLAGQSGNTGCQSLAVTIRGMTLGELTSTRSRLITLKELLLGFINGGLVGISAAIGMYVYASYRQNPDALSLAVVVFVAMVASCMLSGVAGTLIPRVLRRLGADPATASSIFLTTLTDIVSMGALLGLATHFVL
jgi:magnesium transporter